VIEAKNILAGKLEGNRVTFLSNSQGLNKVERAQEDREQKNKSNSTSFFH